MSDGARRILIVEDEGLLALQLRIMLERRGYEVTGCVAGADEAVAAARRDDPDLLVLDIGLARRTSGLEAARSIRGFSGAYFLFVTGYPEEQVIEETRALGPSALIRKPFDEEGLSRALLRAFGASPP
jgi:CheY-like chemotaxis protein